MMRICLRFILLTGLLITSYACPSREQVPTDSPDGDTAATQPPVRDQVSCALSYLSYLGEEATGTNHEIAVKIWRLIQLNIPNVPVLTKNQAADWTIVWGPAVVFSDVGQDQENVMFVAQQGSDPTNYQVVIRGTNFHSIPSWFGDVDVLLSSDWKDTSGNDQGVISKGTRDNLEELLDTPVLTSKSGAKLRGAGLKLGSFLKGIAQTSKISITFTGHSLGGGMAPVLALHFAQSQGSGSPWDPHQNATIHVNGFAGPTPGDAAFAAYFTSVIPDTRFNRYHAKYDMVPRSWNLDQFRSIEDMYAGTGVQGMTVLEKGPYDLLKGELDVLSRLPIVGFVYTHMGESKEFPFPINTGLAPKGPGNTFLDQVEYQHHNSYPHYLGVPQVLKIPGT